MRTRNTVLTTKDVIIPKVNPAGQDLVLPAGKHRIYYAMSGIQETILLDVIEKLGLELPFVHKPDELLLLDYRRMRGFFKSFNHELKDALENENFVFPPNLVNLFDNSSELSLETAQSLIEFAYEMSVPDPSVLNSGKGNTTYGEIRLRQQMMNNKSLNIKPTDVIVDMGSGIGQLVLFSALTTRAKKVYGIELAETPAKLAMENADWFRKITMHYGREIQDFELFQGSFLDEKFDKLIKEEATIFFINNLVFSEELQQDIVDKLMCCKDQTRIVSTKRLALGSRTGKTKSTNSFFNMTTVVKMATCENNASWTSKRIKFYLTTIHKPE